MKAFTAICILLIQALTAAGENRFPKPQFDGGYALPSSTVPGARIFSLEVLDVAVLALALALAAWLVLRKRSRRGIFLLTIFSLMYFGFWREGCVCPVGSIQNVTAWLFDSQYVLPLSVAAFFILPLVFALLFGRVFCAAVCPLGAIQDVVVLFPMRLPAMLTRVLAIIPYIYLGLAVLLAATGAGFIVCRLDPFVAFFRLSGETVMLASGFIFLAIGIVIARPYCRFFCPYGVLLGWMSRLSKWHSTITPDECVNCRLCEQACPFDAILKSNSEELREPRQTGVRRLAWLLVLFPLLVLGGGWAGSRLDTVFAGHHRAIQLAESLERPPTGTNAVPLEVEAFRGTETKPADVLAEADILRKKFKVGGWLFGAFLGAVFGCRLTGLSVRRTRKDYQPDRGLCLSCARCFECCPVGRERQGSIKIEEEKVTTDKHPSTALRAG
jgi:polyferredoxin